MSKEPVAWHYPGGKPDQCTTDKAYAEKDPAWTPMYYKHEWVSLTDDEIWEAYMKAPLTLDCSTDELYALARTVEAKLKEKNNV